MPMLMVKKLAQDTVSRGGSQTLHPGGSLLLFFKVPTLVHVSQCQFRAKSHQSPRHIPLSHSLGLSLLAPSWCTWMMSQAVHGPLYLCEDTESHLVCRHGWGKASLLSLPQVHASEYFPANQGCFLESSEPCTANIYTSVIYLCSEISC